MSHTYRMNNYINSQWSTNKTPLNFVQKLIWLQFLKYPENVLDSFKWQFIISSEDNKTINLFRKRFFYFLSGKSIGDVESVSMGRLKRPAMSAVHLGEDGVDATQTCIVLTHA